ncbi:methyl-accepting chemotaxis protein [Cellulosilyticum sp. ST5]|uniref:methyl-accepting chemotaxis protein n=1 Tax=Cellulosilyticum sp. ST5 TaxID=3055805 RepID=UPI003977AC25
MKEGINGSLKVRKPSTKIMEKGNKTRKKSIKSRLIISYVLFAAIPLLIVNMVASGRFTTTLRNTSKQLTTEMVKQARSNLNYFTNDIQKNVSKFILNSLNDTSNNLLNKYISAEDSNKKMAALNDIRKLLAGITAIEKNISGAMIVQKDGTVLGTVGTLSEEEKKAFGTLEVSKDGLWYRDGKDNIYYLQAIKNSLTGQDNGYFVAGVNMEGLEDDLVNIELFNGANVYAVDEKNTILCGKSPETLSDALNTLLATKEEVRSEIVNKTLYAYATSDNGWKIIAEIPEAALTSSVKSVNLLVWGLVSIIAILAVLVGYLVSKGFTSSIIELMKKMKAAEGGDLTVQVEAKGQDEMHMLCVSFNNMIVNIKKLIEETKDVIHTTLENGEVLSSNTEKSVEAFEQLATSIGDITAGSTRQTEDAATSSVVMEALSSSIQQVRSNTQNVFENTKGARRMIEDATDSIELLNKTMVSSISMSDEIKASILELSMLTKSIEQIMSLVDGISEQTNLLALNASIEAARAGEVGKGFAVVAHEVRNLAEQSKQSTGNVRVTLNTIQQQTTQAVQLVTKSNAIFKEQEHAVQKAYNAFNEIIDRLKNIDTELGLVNHQAIDMQQLRDDMSNKIERITMVTEENASATEEVNALSEEQKNVMKKLSAMALELNKVMDCLDKSVKHFKV